MNDGLPGAVRSITQGADGFLWIGTAGGLVKFDGVAFKPVDAIGTQSIKNVLIVNILFSDDGRMDLGTDGLGELSLARGLGRMIGYSEKMFDVFNLAKGRDGRLWATCNSRLCRLEGDHFVLVNAGDPQAETQAVVVDRFGTVWVLNRDSGGSLFCLREGHGTFERVDGSFDAALMVAADDRLWISGHHGVQVIDDKDGSPGALRTVTREDSGPLQLDRDGNLWVASPRGIRLFAKVSERLREGAAIAPEDALDLHQRTIYTTYEDREGNIWLGTNQGLERFSDTGIVNVTLPPQRYNVYYQMVPAADGGIWASNMDPGLLKIDRTSVVTQPTPSTAQTSTLYAAPDGSLWLANERGLWRGKDGKDFERVSTENMVDTRSMVMDATGALWIDKGLNGPARRFDRGTLTTPVVPSRTPANWNFRASYADSKGRLWFACPDGILMLTPQAARFTPHGSDGLDFGRAITFFERDGHVWVGGNSGIGFFDGQHFHTLLSEKRRPFTGIVETSDGDLWLNEKSETLFVAAADVRDALATSRPFRRVRHFDRLDGRDGSAVFSQLGASLIQDGAGQLWISTDAGVAWIDQRELQLTQPMPTPNIESLLVDGTRYLSTPPDGVPARPQRVEIAYTAPSLTRPERIRFRYRLDGIDTDWQDAGTRRVAYYDHLGPGAYRFRMSSTNADGDWSPVEATFEFRVLPAWFQTILFRLLCVAAAFALLYAAHRMRLHQLSWRLIREQRTQLQERERIARELHDTLLQSVAGLSMLFQSAANEMPESSEQRIRLESALTHADRTLAESRNRIHALRTSNAGEEHFARQLSNMIDSIRQGDRTNVIVRSTGQERALQRPACEALVNVLAEALRNSFKHSRASEIRFDLRYARRHFAIVMHDDGQGMPADVLRAGKDMHWGLLGMRERVTQLGGRYEIESRPGAGTTIRIQVPAAIAYERRPSRM